MLKRWTNPYLILMFTVISIIVTILDESKAQIVGTACLFYITMGLITLRDFYENPEYFPKKRFKILVSLILASLISDLFYNFNWIPPLKIFFLFSVGLSRIIFFGYAWFSTVKKLAHRQQVTNHTIILAITAYLFIGIIWSFIYFTIWEINPDAFHINVQREYELKSWNLAMYFSLVTLTTVGYGDIIPISKWVMVSANFEAMTGAIYLTIIVARLVSLYSAPN